MENNALHKLWKNIGKKDSTFTVDYDTFASAMEDENIRKKVYGNLRKLDKGFIASDDEIDNVLGYTSVVRHPIVENPTIADHPAPTNEEEYQQNLAIQNEGTADINVSIPQEPTIATAPIPQEQEEGSDWGKRFSEKWDNASENIDRYATMAQAHPILKPLADVVKLANFSANKVIKPLVGGLGSGLVETFGAGTLNTAAMLTDAVSGDGVRVDAMGQPQYIPMGQTQEMREIDEDQRLTYEDQLAAAQRVAQAKEEGRTPSKKDLVLSMWVRAAESVSDFADQLAHASRPSDIDENATFIDLVSELEIGDALQLALSSTGQSLPYTAAATIPGGAWLLGTLSASNEYARLAQEKPEMEKWKKYTSSIMSAATEQVIEKWTNPFKGLKGASKKDVGKALMDIKKAAETAIWKRVGKELGKQSLGEGGEEIATSVLTDVFNTLLDIDGSEGEGLKNQYEDYVRNVQASNPDIKLNEDELLKNFVVEKTKEYIEALIMGSLSGLFISGASTAATYDGAQQKDNQQLLSAIQETAAENNISEEYIADLVMRDEAEIQDEVDKGLIKDVNKRIVKARSQELRQNLQKDVEESVKTIAHKNNYIYEVSFVDGSLAEGEEAFIVDGNVVVEEVDGETRLAKDTSDKVLWVRVVKADGSVEVKQVPIAELDLVQKPVTAQEFAATMTELGNQLFDAMNSENGQSSAPNVTDSEQASTQGRVFSNGQQTISASSPDANGVVTLSSNITLPSGKATNLVPQELLDGVMEELGYTEQQSNQGEQAPSLDVASGNRVVSEETGEISVSRLQRRLGIGYNQATDIINQLATEGIVEQVGTSNYGRPIYKVVAGKENELNERLTRTASTGQSIEQAAAPAPSKFPTTKEGKLDWGQMDVPTATEAAIEKFGDKNTAKEYAELQIAQAKKAVAAANKKKATSTDADEFVAQKNAIRQEQQATQAELSKWENVLLGIANYKTAEEQAAAEQAAAQAAAVREQRKQTIEGVGGTNMAERLAASPRIDGNAGSITAADGTKISGHYVLVSANALTPSHNPNANFAPSEGYPTVDGQSINDRDYQADQEEKAKVQQVAQTYDGRAITNMPIVSDEGLVYSGNGRTMAGQLAAANGTDGAYTEALLENAAQFGFTAGQVESVPNARVVFMTDERLPYNTTTLALFNQTEQQTQSNTASAAANVRKLTPEAVGHIIAAVQEFDTVDAFFGDSRVPFELVNQLIADGIISERDKAAFVDNGRLTNTGKDRLTALLFGTAFDEKTIRLLGDNAKVRNSVMRALPQILENKGLGDFSLFEHINNAITAIYDMDTNGMSFFEFTRQIDIEGKTASDKYTAFELLLADEMVNGGVQAFRDVLSGYNARAKESAGGQLDMFTGEVLTTEELTKQILQEYEQRKANERGGAQPESAVAGTSESDGEKIDTTQEKTQKTAEKQTGSENYKKAIAILDSSEQMERDMYEKPHTYTSHGKDALIHHDLRRALEALTKEELVAFIDEFNKRNPYNKVHGVMYNDIVREYNEVWNSRYSTPQQGTTQVNDVHEGTSPRVQAVIDAYEEYEAKRKAEGYTEESGQEEWQKVQEGLESLRVDELAELDAYAIKNNKTLLGIGIVDRIEKEIEKDDIAKDDYPKSDNIENDIADLVGRIARYRAAGKWGNNKKIDIARYNLHEALRKYFDKLTTEELEAAKAKYEGIVDSIEGLNEDTKKELSSFISRGIEDAGFHRSVDEEYRAKSEDESVSANVRTALRLLYDARRGRRKAKDFYAHIDTLTKQELQELHDLLPSSEHSEIDSVSGRISKAEKIERVEAKVKEELDRSRKVVRPKVKKYKYNPFDFATKKDEQRPALNTAHHEDGHVVTSDAHILVAVKQKYDKKLEGKMTDKDGKVVHEGMKYPRWSGIFDGIRKNLIFSTPIQAEDFRSYLEGVKESLKEEWQARKDQGEKVGNFKDYLYNKTAIGIRTPNGYAFYSVGRMIDFANAMSAINATEVSFANQSNAFGGFDSVGIPAQIFAETKDGKAILMPLLVEKLQVEDGRLVSEGDHSIRLIDMTSAQGDSKKAKGSKTKMRVANEGAIQDFASKLGAKGVHLISNKEQLPKEEGAAYRAIKEGERVMGWYSIDTDQVYIYLPNANNIQEIYKTLLHEFVAHKGLRNILGKEKFDELCLQVWDMMSEKDQKQFAIYCKYHTPIGSARMIEKLKKLSKEELDAIMKENKLEAADEYIAHLAETGVSEQNASIWQKIVDWVRGALRDLGVKLELTDQDIAAMLRKSSRALSEDMTIGETTRQIANINRSGRLNNNAADLGFKADVNTSKPLFRMGTQVLNTSDNTLVGLHNISESKLRKALKQGGLANPSAAVIDIAKQDHEQYGEISLVLPSNLIENSAGTFTGDAWTPTYPYVENRMTDKGSDAFYDTIREVFDGVNTGIKNRIQLVFVNMLDNQGNPANLAYWYLKENGIDPTDVVFNSGISDSVKERFAALEEKGNVSKLTAEERETLLELAAEIRGVTKEDLLNEAQRQKEHYQGVLSNEKASSWSRNIAMDGLNQIEEYGVRYDVLSDAFHSIERAIVEDGNVDVERSISQARDYVEEQGLTDDFNQWMEELYDRFSIEEVIFDGYDRNGNRKYIPHTIKNVSRLMNAQPMQNATSHGGLSATRALLIDRLESLSQIRDNKDRLTALSDEENEQWKQMQDEWYNNVLSPLSDMQKVDSNPFINTDIAEQRLLEAITEPNPIAYLNKEYGYSIPLQGKYAQTLNKMIKQLKEMPTKYFETKFDRPVYISEFAGAVVPNNLSQDLKDELRSVGLGLYEYDQSVDGSRRQATLDATNDASIRFRISEDMPTGEEQVRFSIVEDPATIERLEASEKIIGYRNVVLNEDGTFGSPMASSLQGEGRKVKTAGFELNMWEQAEENLNLVDKNGKIDLVKPDGKSIRKVDYNPYIHNRPNKVNRQFKQAWERPNLVYIESEIAKVDLDEKYHAEKAKKSVGVHNWNGGKLILSRYDKPIRIVPWEEVADDWEKAFKKRGVEFDIVPPALLPILHERGVEILPPHKNMGEACNTAYKQWKTENPSPRFRISAEEDAAYVAAVNRGDMETAQRMVNNAAKRAIPNTKVVDADGSPLVMYHGDRRQNRYVFGTDTFFSPNREYAARYIGADGEIYQVYLNIEKPFDIRNAKDYDIFTQYRNGNKPAKTNTGAMDWAEYDYEDLQMYLEENYPNQYDGFILDEGGDPTAEGGVKMRGLSYVPYSSNQIKSAEVVTYDDNGNVIPLSERFNEEQGDIRFRITPAEDQAYADAVARGDMDAAQEMLRDAADKMGYAPLRDYKDAHRAPSASVSREDFTNADVMRDLADESYDTNLWAIAQGISAQPEDYFSPQGARLYGYRNQSGMESYASLAPAIRSINYQLAEYGEVREMPSVKVYRTVPTSIVGMALESEGQWVSPSYEYAVMHGLNRFGEGEYRIIEQDVPADQLWWDGNDIREWGFDDGTINTYQNTKNNRKLYEVTYDDNGNLIPLSKRFDKRNSDIRFRIIGEQGAASLDQSEEATTRLDNLAVAREMESANKDEKSIKLATGWERGADGKWRYEVDESYNFENPVVKEQQLEREHRKASNEYYSLLTRIPYRTPKYASDAEKQRIVDARKKLKILKRKLDKAAEAYYSYRGIKFGISLESLIGENNALFNEYPQLRDVGVQFANMANGERGSYSKYDSYGREYRRILINKLLFIDDMKSTLAHEIQHAIQDIEGFAQGGNPQIYAGYKAQYDQRIEHLEYLKNQYGYKEWFASLSPDNVLRIREQYKAEKYPMTSAFVAEGNLNEDQKNNLTEALAEEQKYEQLFYNAIGGVANARADYYDWYRSLAGETESRNVQSRLGMSAEERRSTLLSETEDVAREDQVFIYNAIEDASNDVRFRVVYDPMKDKTLNRTAAREMAEIKANAERNGTYLKAPNGADTNLTPRQWLQVRTRAFKEWFGDWENDADNASKIVDENGEPMVVYHATPYEFTEFNTKYSGRNTGDAWLGHGMYFSTHKSTYYGKNIMPVFLNIRKPADILGDKWQDFFNTHTEDFTVGYKGLTYKDFLEDTKGNYDYLGLLDKYGLTRYLPEREPKAYDVRSQLRRVFDKYGFDGVIADGAMFGLDFVAYEPNQIKSATENVGTFDDSSDDIRFRISNENQRIFVSNAERAVEAIKQDKATPQQWQSMLEKSGGIKAGEDKWLGLSDWLKSQDKKSITKQEILDFIAENQIQIEEVEYEEYDMQSVFEGYRREYKQYYDEAVADNAEDPQEDAWQRMIEEHGEDFSMGFYAYGDELQWDADSNYVKWELENSSESGLQPINNTRMQYTTEGLENKQEIALTVPTIESWNETDEVHFGDAGGGRAVAWVRFGETIDEDGRKVLVIDEIQSKRHQEGREKGYRAIDTAKNVKRLNTTISMLQGKSFDIRLKLDHIYNDVTPQIMADEDSQEMHRLDEELWFVRNNRDYGRLQSEIDKIKAKYYPPETNELKKELEEINEELERLYKERDAIKDVKKIPDAPFDKNWHELAMKRMLRYAAENGYDYVAWTTGEQQSERYDLGKRFDSIDREDNPSINGRRFALNGANYFTFVVNEEGIVTESDMSEMQGKPLADVVGKDLAVRMMSLENGDAIEGADLRIGGEGMKGFYDKMLPSFVNKYTKKWGGKVQDIKLYDLEESAQTMHAVNVTPEMKESVMAGQTMFRMADHENKWEDVQASIAVQGNDVDGATWYEKAGVIQDFLEDEFGADIYPIAVVPMDADLREWMEYKGIDPKLVDYAQQKMRNKKHVIRGFHSNGTIFVLSQNIPSLEVAKLTYAHEAQHIDNKMHSELVIGVLDLVTRQEALDFIGKFGDIKEYKELLNRRAKGYYTLADEVIAYAMSEGYKLDVDGNLAQHLRDNGVTNEELINLLNNEYEQQKTSPSKSRRILQRSNTNTNSGNNTRGARQDGGDIQTPSRAVEQSNEYGTARRSRESVRDVVNNAVDSILRAEAKRIARRNTQNVTPVGTDSGVRFRMADAPMPTENETKGQYLRRLSDWIKQQETYEAKMSYKKSMDRSNRTVSNIMKKLVDKHKPIEDFQRWIVSRGGKLGIATDAYKDVTMSVGRAGYQISRFSKMQFQRLLNAISDIVNSNDLTEVAKMYRWKGMEDAEFDGKELTPRELIGIYCQAMDVKEARDMGLPDRGEDGFKNNIESADGSEVTFEKIIDVVEDAVSHEKRSELWQSINDATQFSLDYQLASGMIDQETHDEYTKRSYYVPERGWRVRDMDGREDKYLRGQGITLNGSPYNAALQRARGRKSLAADPFAYIQSIAESSIMSSEKNKVKQKFLQMLMDNQQIGLESGAWRVRRVWVVEKRDVYGDPVLDDNGNPETEIVFTKPQDESTIVSLRTSDERLQLQLQQLMENRTRDERMQHRVTIVKDGQSYVVDLNNEELANALNGNFAEAKLLSNSAADFTRNMVHYMSAINTQYNPTFAIWNFVRDLQTAMISNVAEQDAAFTALFLKNIPMVQGAIWRYVTNDKVMGREVFSQTEMGRYLQEYFEHGAQTGFSFLRDIDALNESIDEQLSKGNARKAIGKAAGKVADVASIATEVSELSIRFAQYVTARQTGKSAEEAANMAKEISVNFDRKGEWSGALGAIYSFFNASVQGTNKFIRLVRSSKKAAGIFAGSCLLYMVLGALNTLLVPDDPEEEEFYSDYTRMTNFIFGKIKLPVAHFFRMFWAAGVNIALAGQGRKTWDKASYDTLDFMANELIPASALQVNNFFEYNDVIGEIDFEPKKYFQGAAPTYLTPISDIMLNRNFMGGTVNREAYIASDKETKKRSAFEKRNTPEIYHMIADAMSGGNPNIETRGIDDGWGVDVSANDVQHFIEGYTGGVGRTIGDIVNLTIAAVDPEQEVDQRHIPVWNKMIRPYQVESSYNQEFWTLYRGIEHYKKELREMQKLEDKSYINKETNSEKYKAYLAIKDLVKTRPTGEEVHTPQDVQRLMEANELWRKVR